MKPSVYHDKDGSTLIEWISKDFRFGISIEPNPQESSWWFVTKDYGDCGKLTEEMRKYIREPLSLYVNIGTTKQRSLGNTALTIKPGEFHYVPD